MSYLRQMALTASPCQYEALWWLRHSPFHQHAIDLEERILATMMMMTMMMTMKNYSVSERQQYQDIKFEGSLDFQFKYPSH